MGSFGRRACSLNPQPKAAAGATAPISARFARCCALLAWGAVAAGAAACAPDDPLDFGAPRDCSIPEQNAWVYALMQEAYLWSEFVPTDLDPSSFESPKELVAEVRYDEQDRWSRISDLATTQALFEEGKVIGLGFRTQRVDEELRLSFVDPMSPAGLAGLSRGDWLVGVGGQSRAELDENDGWDAALGANEPGVAVALQIAASQDGPGAETSTTFDLVRDWYPLVTVPYTEVLEHRGVSVGYLLFTSFLEPSQGELDTAFERFVAAGVEHVIIDMRYNGGGRISTASHLMSLLVGGMASGKVAYKTAYNAQLSDTNSSRDLSGLANSLPRLEHVAFITTGSSASASELVINGVLPYTQVSVVGGRTAGKPVGSAQWEFCEQAAHPITFRLLNANDEGDYFDGFTPTCVADDVLAAPLADASEGSIAAALEVLLGRACPTLDEDDAPPPESEGSALGLRPAPAPLPGRQGLPPDRFGWY